MSVVGPGSIKQEEASPKPTLEGASEYEYITILNPLPDDFQVMVAQDIPVNMPFELRNPTTMTKSEGDVVMKYGIDLKNPEHAGKKYIYNTAIIPAGQTMNFKGSEAQVVVRQLVSEILQREGKRRLMADPNLRKEVEERIIKGRGSVQELLDNKISTPSQQVDEALNQLNEVNHEEFPGLNPSPGTGANYSPKKKVGRPAKAQRPRTA